MRMKRIVTKAATRLMVVALAVAGAATTAQAQLEGQLVLRPVTDVDIERYGLPADIEFSGGLTTIGVGAPVYLEVDVSTNNVSDVTNVIWTLSKPVGSSAALTTSPLGTNVPIFEPSSRLVSRVVARRLLRPDIEGTNYIVTATIMSASNGNTNVSKTITVGHYLGIQSCATCHSGGIVAPDKYTTWSQTLHAQIFADQIDGHAGPLRASCLACHTTGYDTNSLADNGGFDDVARQFGWTPPSVLMDGNWASMQTNYPQVANLANVQCESCHGAGSQHVVAEALNPHGPAGKAAISVITSSGTCNQCHDAADHHPYGTEWLNSGHAVAPDETSSGCVRCHNGTGFANYVDGEPAVDLPYEPINCAGCHDPHDPANAHQLRTLANVTLMDTSKPGGPTVVTNGGKGKICMNCHISRRDAVTYAEAPHSHYGPHHGPQTDMLEGVNAITYGKEIPSSAHRNAVPDTCVTCHMQDVASSDPGFLHVGEHTWSMKWDNGTNTIEATKVCGECHGDIESFDFKRQDFDGDGVVEGVQTEVKGLMAKLAMMLPPIGQPTVDDSDGTVNTLTQPQLKALYNYLFVEEDGSFGIHNLSYAVGVLKASIADMSGVSSPGGMPDSWVMQYFGSLTNAAASPDAINNVNGLPNWMMYALGLSPFSSSTAVNGVVYVNDGNIVNGATNSVAIYTAAEVAFDTQVGTTYTVQGITALTGTWMNISTNIPGTGGTVSYLTPTRDNTQMFYRVVHTP